MVALLWDDNQIQPIAPQAKSNEWYTPARYVEAARHVMGGIDLDPASCALANQTVKASRYYTQEENGLSKEWYGRVWLNPPYGRVNGSGASVIRMFVTRLVDKYKTGSVKQAILLTTVQTNCTWFQLLWDYPVCFTSHRVAFVKPIHGHIEPDSRTSHTLGTALVYLGPNEPSFIETFSQFGRIARAIDTPKRQTAPLSLWEALAQP